MYQMQAQTFVEPVPRAVIVPNLSDLPAEISYFYIYLPATPKVINPDPIKAHALTYTGDPTLKQLMEKYREDTGYAPPNATIFNFALQSGIKLAPEFTISDLKKHLARDSVDGMFLQPQFSTGNPEDEDQYIDQCSVQDYYKNQKEYGKKTSFWLRTEVTLEGCPNTEILYIQCISADSKDSLLNKIFAQLSKQYGLKNLDPKRVLDISYISSKGVKPQTLVMSYRVFNQKVYEESIVTVKLSNPKKEQLKRINAPKYNSWMVIYKENETEPIKVKYDDIANLTIADLYRSKLQLKESEKRRDVVYCIKIMDNIYTPQQKVNSAEVYFKNIDNKKTLHVVAKVVNDKMIFYKSVPALAANKNAEFKLKEITIPPYQKNRREQCERTVRERAEKTSHQYFKNAENVEPITIYTSELMYTDPVEKKDLVIYQSLNKYLRETPILSLQRQSFDREWRLRYASTLLKHLQKIRLFVGNTWRGVSYDPCLSKKDVGTVLTFKQFTSTSNRQQTAINFAKNNGAKAPYHMFAFKVKTGRQIIEYSLYCEGQVLLQPYTEFELTAVVNQKHDSSNFKVYYLQERVTSKLLPGIVANFVIWIDSNVKEAKEMFSRVQLPAETTIFQQLKSTNELEGWIGRHKNLFTDKTANLIFLTNMSRQEQNGFNEYAGIDAAKLIRQYSKTAPIFFYIGNVETARRKLDAKKMNMDKVFVGDNPQQVLNFLEQNIAGSI